MRNFFSTTVEKPPYFLRLRAVDELKKYAFRSLEVSTENGEKLKSEIKKTIYLTIKKQTEGFFKMQLETFDRTYKNKTVSISEKEFLHKIASVADDLIVTVDAAAQIKAINNVADIGLKSETVTNKLAQKYKGQKATKMYSYLNRFYSNEERIKLDVAAYRNFGLLFNQNYGNFINAAVKKNKVRHLNFMDETVANVEEDITLVNVDEELAEVEIKVNGILAAPVYRTMFLKAMSKKNIAFNENDEPQLNKYEGSFVYDTNSGLVKNASIQIEFSYGNNYSKTITYQLNEIINADNN